MLYVFIIQREAFERTKDRFGGLHIVCNNAGIGAGCEDMWEKMIEINLVSIS